MWFFVLIRYYIVTTLITTVNCKRKDNQYGGCHLVSRSWTAYVYNNYRLIFGNDLVTNHTRLFLNIEQPINKIIIKVFMLVL